MGDLRLKHVMQTELNLPRGRAHGTDQAPGTVVNPIVGVPIAGNVEDVEEIRPEAEYMLLLPQVEVLKQRHIDLPIAGCTLGAVVGSSKRIRSRHTIGADPVVRATWILLSGQARLR